MFLTPRTKPELNPFYQKYILQIPNAIPAKLAMDLRNYAVDKNVSGLHRRNGNSYAPGNFSTCLVHDFTDSVYETIDNLWKTYGTSICKNLEFIEPYEIKCYDISDHFSNHIDSYGFFGNNVDRQVTLTIQLSKPDEYDGGDLMVGPIKCSKELGTAIFFPASYWHKITRITKGRRFSIISWGWGPTIN